jgi:hypothetical protein
MKLTDSEEGGNKAYIPITLFVPKGGLCSIEFLIPEYIYDVIK